MVKIKVPSYKPTYSHKYSTAVNTTSNFGYEQPLFVRALAKGDKISVDSNIVTRCMPMISPAMASFKTHIRGVFVPYHDVCSGYESTKTNMPYKGVTYSWYPLITNNQLFVQILLCGGIDLAPVNNKTSKVDYNLYVADNLTSVADLFDSYMQSISPSSTDLYIDIPVNSLPSSYGASSILLPTSGNYKSIAQDTEVGDLSAFDVFINTQDMKESTITGYDSGFYVVGRYNDIGKQYLKLYQGLGYNPMNYQDTDRISMLPLMCLGKALYCMNAIQRDSNFTSSLWYCFCNNWDETIGVSGEPRNRYTMSDSGLLRTTNYLGRIFKELLTYSIHTMPTDAWSCGTRKPTNSVDVQAELSANPQNNIPQDLDTRYSDLVGTNNIVGIKSIDEDLQPYSAIGIQTALKLAKFFNAQSVFGKNIAAYLKSKGYNVTSLDFRNTPIVYDKIEEVSINEIFSNSNTFDGTNGSELGDYAGRGICSSNGTFHFTAEEDGILFMFYSLIPRIGWCHTTSPYLYNVNRYTAKDGSVYDGLGYEVLPMSCMDQGFRPTKVNTTKYTVVGGYRERGFQFQPRLTIWKQIPDTLNGDMSLPSLFNTYLPYHDELIREKSSIDSKDACGDWMRKPWMEYDYNRFFYTTGQLKSTLPIIHGSSLSYDNFMVQGRISVIERNQLKPLSDTWDTLYQEGKTTDVTQS